MTSLESRMKLLEETMTDLAPPPDPTVASPEQAVDADKARRPGNPMEHVPAPIANAHWLTPDQQPAVPGLLVDPSRTLTCTFGTQQPPRGLSGMLRRAAYRLPDYRMRRWAMLIFADRVDALESRLARTARHPATWLAIAGTVMLLVQLRRRV